MAEPPAASAISWASAELFDLHAALKLQIQGLREREEKLELERQDFESRRKHWRDEVDRRVQAIFDDSEQNRKLRLFESLKVSMHAVCRTDLL